MSRKGRNPTKFISDFKLQITISFDILSIPSPPFLQPCSPKGERLIAEVKSYYDEIEIY